MALDPRAMDNHPWLTIGWRNIRMPPKKLRKSKGRSTSDSVNPDTVSLRVRSIILLTG